MNESLISPRGAESRGAESPAPERIFSFFGIVVYAASALIIAAALFINVEPQYVAQPVPALAVASANSGLALLAGLPLP